MSLSPSSSVRLPNIHGNSVSGGVDGSQATMSPSTYAKPNGTATRSLTGTNASPNASQRSVNGSNCGTVGHDEKHETVSQNVGNPNEPMVVFLPQPGPNGTQISSPAFVFPNYASMAASFQQGFGMPMGFNFNGNNNDNNNSSNGSANNGGSVLGKRDSSSNNNNPSGSNNGNFGNMPFYGMPMPFYGMPINQMNMSYANQNNNSNNSQSNVPLAPASAGESQPHANDGNVLKKPKKDIESEPEEADDIHMFNEHENEHEPEQSADGDSDEGSNRNARWSKDEEVVLRGVSSDCNLFLGGHVTWQKIRQSYNIAIQRYNVRLHATNPRRKPFTLRTMCSIKKHFRIMYRELQQHIMRKDKPADCKWFAAYHDEWMSAKFNKNRDLISYPDVLKLSQRQHRDRSVYPDQIVPTTTAAIPEHH